MYLNLYISERAFIHLKTGVKMGLSMLVLLNCMGNGEYSLDKFKIHILNVGAL